MLRTLMAAGLLTSIAFAAAQVNVYSHRHYAADKQLFETFEKKTGIKVNVVKAKADELIKRLESEGENSPADILITADAARLHLAKSKGLLQSVDSAFLNATVPAKLRDRDGRWFALTKRARIIVYNKDTIDPGELSTYEALTEEKFRKKILIRKSSNVYNQSLLASIIANDGEEAARKWAEGMVRNFARTPRGNDRDQMKAVAAGFGDIAVVNTYYVGKLLNSRKINEVAVGKKMGVFFPNQEGRGTHINISGAGVVKHSPNKDNAVALLEFLLSQEAQRVFARANYEYPVNPEVAPSKLLQSWGAFKEDDLPLNKLGENNAEAVQIFNEAGWR